MQPMKSDIISPNTGPYAASGPMSMTNQALQAEAARKARRKEVEGVKQDKYASMIAELEAPWIRDSQNYKTMKDGFNKQLSDYHREHGRIDLTDPTLLQGYQQLKDYAVYSKQTKKHMEDIIGKVDPKNHDDIHFRRQWEQIQQIDNPFERASAIANAESQGGFLREKYLDYGKSMKELEPNIRGLKMTEFEGTSMNNKRKVIIAADYIEQQVKNTLQSDKGMTTWTYALEGEVDVPEVKGFDYVDQDGQTKFMAFDMNKKRKEYSDLLAANTDDQGNLTPEGQELASAFIYNTNEEYVQAYSQERAMEYVDRNDF